MAIKPGTIRTIMQEYIRHECAECGEPATKKVSYLLPNARSNPASSGYHGDDITWCSDHQEFICGDCKPPRVEGFDLGTIYNGDYYPHMVHFFREISREDKQPKD